MITSSLDTSKAGSDEYLAQRVSELEGKLANQYRYEGQVQLLKEENEKLTKMLIDKTAESVAFGRSGSSFNISRLSSIEGGDGTELTKNEVEILRHEIKILNKCLEEKNHEIKSLKQDVLSQHVH